MWLCSRTALILAVFSLTPRVSSSHGFHDNDMVKCASSMSCPDANDELAVLQMEVSSKSAAQLDTDVLVSSGKASAAAVRKSGGGIPTPFFDPEELNPMQLLFLTAIYGYVLFVASDMIGEGSEGLLFFPSVAGIVGNLVVPILGAVPDGMMVFFSGMGEDAQEKVSVGVGALAGSTVMLVTIPWFLSVVCGAVPIGTSGAAVYSGKGNEAQNFITNYGVTYTAEIPTNAKVMLITSLLYFVVQLPAFFLDTDAVTTEKQAARESMFALVGAIVCVVSFGCYCAFCYFQSSKAVKDKKLASLVAAIKEKKVCLGAVLLNFREDYEGELEFKQICRPFYASYVVGDEKEQMHFDVFQVVLKDVGETLSVEQAKQVFDKRDANKDGNIQFNEFCACIREHLVDIKQKQKEGAVTRLSSSKRRMPEIEDEEEEEFEMPEDLEGLEYSTQARVILMRSFWNMGVGTLLVVLFSDPAVDVLGCWGKLCGISPFYVSFLLAPWAANASEVLVAVGYASQKSSKTITMSLSSLVGAACLNNTFVLSIFYFLVWLKGLAWQFKAETMSIILVQWMLGLQIVFSRTQRVGQGFLILMLYPGCLGIITLLEKVLGWD